MESTGKTLVTTLLLSLPLSLSLSLSLCADYLLYLLPFPPLSQKKQFGLLSTVMDNLIGKEGWNYGKLFGPTGQPLVDADAAYNFEEQHKTSTIILGGDYQGQVVGGADPLIFHYGRFTDASVMVQSKIEILHKLAEEFAVRDGFNTILGVCILPQYLYLLGELRACDDFFTKLFGSFDGIVPVFLNWAKTVSLIAVEQDGVCSDGMMSMDSITFQTKAIWSLCCQPDSPIFEEAKLFLQDAKLATPEAHNTSAKVESLSHNISKFCGLCRPYFIALANERFGEYERAMKYANPGCKNEPGVKWRAFYHCLRGRILGRSADTKVEAEAAFEAAIAEARSCELVYIENMALRDLNRFVRPSGISERISKAQEKFVSLAGDNLTAFNRILDNHCNFP